MSALSFQRFGLWCRGLGKRPTHSNGSLNPAGDGVLDIDNRLLGVSPSEVHPRRSGQSAKLHANDSGDVALMVSAARIEK
jgi:hypothetical protein